jgi:hypothetical protein
MLGAIWKRWHWLDDGLLPLAATVSYAAWAYPVFAVYVRDPAAGTRVPGFTFWLCLGILLSGTIAGRLASQGRRGPAIVIGGGIVSVLACLLLIVPSSAAEVRAWSASPLFLPMVIAGMVCAVLLWWRGVRLAQADHHEETSWTFVVGALALACLLFVSHMHHDARAARTIAPTLWILAFLAVVGIAVFLVMLSLLRVLDERVLLSGVETALACAAALLTSMSPAVPAPGELSGPFLLFVAFGLTTRSLLGVSWVLNNQRGRGGVRLHVDRNWLVVMLGAVLGVVSLGLLVGEILTPDAVRSAWGWVRPVLALLTGIVALFVLAVLLFALWLVRLIAPRFRFRLPEITLPSAEELEGLGERTLELAPSLKQMATILLILAVLSLVVWVLYRAARRLHLGAWAHVDTTEDRDQILSWQLLLQQLRDVLRGLRERGGSPFVGLGPPGNARRAIRKVYQKVLGRAIALGTPREKGQTPETYERTLSDLAPDAQASLETLTSAYETARYGVVPPTREQAKGAEEAFVDIDSALRAEAKRRASQVDLSDADPHTRS